MHENATTAKADVLFPLETHAEKDGTVTHPDGRLQRVRPSAGRPGDIRPNFQVLAELCSAARPRHRHHLPTLGLRRSAPRRSLLRRHPTTHRRPGHPLAGDGRRGGGPDPCQAVGDRLGGRHRASFRELGADRPAACDAASTGIRYLP